MAGARRKGAAKPSAREEQEQRLFDQVKAFLESLGYDVHVSKTLDGRGGSCVVHGSNRVIVSRRLPVVERVDVLVDVLRRLDLSAAIVPAEIAPLLAGAPESAS